MNFRLCLKANAKGHRGSMGKKSKPVCLMGEEAK